MSKANLIGEALAQHTAEHGTTGQRVMYLGRGDGAGSIPTNDPVYPRSVWAHELNKQPEQVLLPDWSTIPLEDNPALENTPIMASKPPGLDKLVLSLSTHLAGQQALGQNGVTPFESRQNDIASQTLIAQPANWLFASPDTAISITGGQPVWRRQTLNDIPTVSTVGLPLVAGATAPSYAVLGIAGGGTGAATLTAHALVVGNGTGTVNALAPSTARNVAISDGTDWTSRALIAADTPLVLPLVGGTLTGPVVFTPQAAPSTTEGKVYYDSTAHALEYYNGSAWVSLTADTGITQLTGDVTAGPGSGSQAATLATVNSNVGAFAIATVTANAKGLITAVSAASTTGSGSVVLATSPTIVTPTIADFTNATHNHQNTAGGGTLDAAAIASGTLNNARVNWAAPGTLGSTTPNTVAATTLVLNSGVLGTNTKLIANISTTTDNNATAIINTLSGSSVSKGVVVQAVTVATATITNKALTSNVATLTTSAAHGFSIGQTVAITGVDATFNGLFTVRSTPSSTTFTYPKVATNVGSTGASGTATVNNTGNLAEYQDSAGNILSFIDAFGRLYIGSAYTGAAAAGASKLYVSDGSITSELVTESGGIHGFRTSGTIATSNGNYTALASVDLIFNTGSSPVEHLRIGRLTGVTITGSNDTVQTIIKTNSTQTSDAFQIQDGQQSNAIRVKWDQNFIQTTAAFDAGTNAVLNALVVGHNTSAGASVVANYGTGVLLTAQDNNTANTNIARWRAFWNAAVHTSQAATVVFSAYGTAEQDAITIKTTSGGTIPLIGFGTVSSPTAYLHLPAGTTAASGAPLKFNSGTSMTSAEAGAVEFTTDDLFFTITTSTARKRVLFADPSGGLTSGRVPYNTTNGRLTDTSGFTFDGTTLTTSKLALTAGSGSGAPKVGGSLFAHHANVGNTTILGADDDLYSDTIPASTLATNDDLLEAQYGGTFVSSATATREVKVWFGGTAVFDTGALTLSLSAAWTAYVTVIRVSATVVRYMISFTTEGAALAAYTAVGELTGLTLSNTNILKITGAAAGVGAAANDIVAKLATVAWYPAP